jgi:hypothetical protein
VTGEGGVGELQCSAFKAKASASTITFTFRSEEELIS